MHLWANLSREQCVWAAVYYDRKRQEGKSHATALRCLGQRWAKILQRMRQDRRPYDVVVFDPDRVGDRATYDQPRLVSEGIEHVWVNGCRVVSDGSPCRPDAPPGRALRYRQS